MRPIHLVAMILWRGGLLLAGAAAFFEVARWVLRLIEVPVLVEAGLGLVIAGLLMLIVSLVVERVQDSRAEGELHEWSG